MKLKINGKETELTESSVSVIKLLEIQKVDMPDMVTVELNGDILDREQFESTTVKDGDELEFLYFMGGGAQ